MFSRVLHCNHLCCSIYDYCCKCVKSFLVQTQFLTLPSTTTILRMDHCVAIEEACCIIRDYLSIYTDLSIRDLCRCSVKRTSCQPHQFRTDIFQRANVSQFELQQFELLCLNWVKNGTKSILVIMTAVRELLNKGSGLLSSSLSTVARCLAVEAAINRLYFTEKGIRFLKLYRGLHKLSDAYFVGGSKHTLCLQRRLCESQTSSLMTARMFGPYIMQATVPVSCVLMCHRTNTVFMPHEHEYVIVPEKGTLDLHAKIYSHLKRGVRSLFMMNARLYMLAPDAYQPSAVNHNKENSVTQTVQAIS